MRVLICGGRDWTDEDAVFAALDSLDAERRIECVIEGGQRTYDPGTKQPIGGADLHGCRWTYARARWGMRFDAEWHVHGRAAGPIRNARMIEEGKPDLVLAFPGGRGTADCVKQARAAGIEVREVSSRPLQEPS